MRDSWLHTGGLRFGGAFGLAVALFFMIPRLLSGSHDVAMLTLITLWAIVSIVMAVGIRALLLGVRVVPPILVVRNLLHTHRVKLVDIERVSTKVKWGGHMGCIELSNGRELMMHGLQQANPFTSRKPLELLSEALDVIEIAASDGRSDA